MIRLVQRQLIIPRGDTGTFSIPAIAKSEMGDASIFTIFDPLKHKKIFEKEMQLSDGVLSIDFTHGDTVNLPVGQFVWDIKFYKNVRKVDGLFVDGDEIDSYYAAFKLPVCEIRQTGDALLSADDAPTSTIAPEQLNVILAAGRQIHDAQAAVAADAAEVTEMKGLTEQMKDTAIDAADTATAAATSADASASAAQQDAASAADSMAQALVAQAAAETAQSAAEASEANALLYKNAASASATAASQAAETATASAEGAANSVIEMQAAVAAIPTRVGEFENDVGYLVENDLASVAMSGDYGDLENKPFIPTRISDLTDDSGHYTKPVTGIPASDLEETYLTSFTETDPTVPAWAKAAQKPTYTAQEVGALPANTHIPSTTQELTNDAGFITAAALPTKVSDLVDDSGHYTKPVAGIPASDLEETYLTQHQDISGKANLADLATVATSGSYTDLANKPTNVSEFNNDAGYLTSFTETDPTVPSWAKAAQKPSYTAAEVGAPTIAEMNTAIGNAIGNINSFDMSVVQALPTENISNHTIYLVPKTGDTNDVYDEYVYINNGWEMVGNTQIDLSNYVQKNQYATSSTAGLVRINLNYGLVINPANGDITTRSATTDQIKIGTDQFRPITSRYQHESTFYGLAKAAGSDEKDSELPVGTYSTAAKSAIRSMIGAAASEDITVQDVQVNGTSVLDNGVAVLPLIASVASLPNVKTGTWTSVYISPGRQHQATFYGLATAAGDTTQKNSDNAVGTYTTEAKTAIQQMLGVPSVNDIPNVPVQDVQINGVSALNSGVANIPIASDNTFGVIKRGNGLYVGANDGKLNVNVGGSSNIKSGSGTNIILCVGRQHESAFYGLAKAAGDSTQSSSDNAVGVYTDEAKAAINTMLGSVSKVSLDNAGIASKTYSVKFGGQFTVTTAANSDYISPYARASVTGRISKHYKHRVTFDGTEYILDTGLWFTPDRQKTYEYLGNLSLYVEDVSGVLQAIDNVPFVIISDLNDNSSIDVLTSVAGTHTIKVEQITPVQTRLPNSLLYGDEYASIQKKNNGGTYNGFSVGVNELKNSRATIAIGYFNSINNDFSQAYGEKNQVSGGYASGHSNNVIGYGSQAFGGANTVNNGGLSFGLGNSSDNGLAFGQFLTAKYGTVVLGQYNIEPSPLNIEYPQWAPNTEYKIDDVVAYSNLPSKFICTQAHTSANNFLDDYWNYWSPYIPPESNASVIIGNGFHTKPSNGLMIDIYGDTHIRRNIYVNCNPDSTGGTLVPTDIQINGTSVVDAQGVVNIPISSSTQYGVIKLASSYGIEMNSNDQLQIVMPSDNEIKTGYNSARRAIMTLNQHKAVFYGLSKAAGVDLANETVTFGTYPETSKTAIRSMIGATNGDVIAIQDTQPTANDVKLWLPETMPAAVDVPTMDDLEDYVQKTDYATDTTVGVIKIGPSMRVYSSGTVDFRAVGASEVKAGTTYLRALTPERQHASVFYGLAKAAGADMASSDNAIGTYTDVAKSAIRNMIGAIGNDDYATSSTGGIVKVNSAQGISFTSDNQTLRTNGANESMIQAGAHWYCPILPVHQHLSVFFGLAKVAGVDLASETYSSYTNLAYTDTAKSAIRTMIGAISNTDYATASHAGIVKVVEANGIGISNANSLYISAADITMIKAGTSSSKAIAPAQEHASTFYGLAKAAGDTTQSASSNAVGTYTPEAKAAIHTMLGIDPASIAAQVDIPLIETVTGTTPIIVGQPNVRYVCGEVSTITITPPSSGSVDVIFESGSTPAVMTVPNTVKWPAWFDATTLDTGTTYEILITDGVYGSVMTWAT